MNTVSIEEASGSTEIVERYEALIDAARETVHEINDLMRCT